MLVCAVFREIMAAGRGHLSDRNQRRDSFQRRFHSIRKETASRVLFIISCPTFSESV